MMRFTVYSAVVDSLLLLSWAPTRTLNCPGRSTSRYTQWAAVTMVLAEIIEPPHIERPFFSIRICHGQEPGTASVPAITRCIWMAGLPQVAGSGEGRWLVGRLLVAWLVL